MIASAIRLGCAAFLLVAGQAAAQEQCKRPTAVSSLDDVRTHFLTFKSKYGHYVVDNQCNLINPKSLGSRVQFSFIPPQRTDDTTAYIFIKSYRVFGTEPPDKIKMSRGSGWFSGSGAAAEQRGVEDQPYLGTVDEWNTAHSGDGGPEDLQNRLKFLWHAYAQDDKQFPSTMRLTYWKTRGDFDFSHGSLTNYLIRFAANSKTPIPFNVGISQAKEFQLELYSNIEELSGSYRFVLK